MPASPPVTERLHATQASLRHRPRFLLQWSLMVGGGAVVTVFAFWLLGPAVGHSKVVAYRDIAGVSGTTHIDLNPLDERSYIYDRNGAILAVLHADQNREVVTLDQV